MNFASLGLAPELLHAIKVMGFTKMTPVQQQTIAPARKGGDILATAQTGTGKTLAYCLPVLQQLVEKNQRVRANTTRALILTPTRELAQQINETLQALIQFLEFRLATAYGGVKMSGQINKLNAGLDILVATPGRLKEHVEQGHIDLSQTDCVVLDEADRMLDMGFVHDIHFLLTRITAPHQTLCFSATASQLVNALANQAMKNPRIITVDRRNAVANTIEHVVYPVEEAFKYELFVKLLREQNWFQVMAFTSTREEADKLIRALKDDKVESAVVHSEKTQGARSRALKDFKSGKLQVLVATEVAARGLDIQGLELVVNLNLPFYTEDYVHRVGRTGRAGNAGKAISLVGPEEAVKLAMIEELIGQKIPRVNVKGYDVYDFPENPETPKMRADARSSQLAINKRTKNNAKKKGNNLKSATKSAPGKRKKGPKKKRPARNAGLS